MNSALSFTDHLFARALELEERGFLAEACRAFRRLLHIRPLNREDESASFDQDGQHFRTCVDLQPDNAFYMIDLARHLGQSGQKDEAHELMRKAVEQGGEDIAVVGAVAEAMREMGEFDEAQTILRQAQFRHARDPRFQQIWKDHRFQELWARQQAERADRPDDGSILRFVPRMKLMAGSAG